MENMKTKKNATKEEEKAWKNLKSITQSCKTCKKICSKGLWLSPQFIEEKVLLFCSEKCMSEWKTIKLQRVKTNYPEYYSNIIKVDSKAQKKKNNLREFFGILKAKEGEEFEKRIKERRRKYDSIRND